MDLNGLGLGSGAAGGAVGMFVLQRIWEVIFGSWKDIKKDVESLKQSNKEILISQGRIETKLDLVATSLGKDLDSAHAKIRDLSQEIHQ